NRLGLLGQVDGAHPPFAELLEQLVGADERRNRLRAIPEIVGSSDGSAQMRGRLPEEVANVLARCQKRFDLTAQLRVVGTLGVQKLEALLTGLDFGCTQKQLVGSRVPIGHRRGLRTGKRSIAYPECDNSIDRARDQPNLVGSGLQRPIKPCAREKPEAIRG